MTSKQKAAIKYNIKQKLLKGEITQAEYNAQVQQLQDLATAGASLQEANTALGMYSGKKKTDPFMASVNQALKNAQTAQAMTHQEYIGVWEDLNKKKKAGEITAAQYKEAGKKLDDLYNQQASLETAKKAVGIYPLTMDEYTELLGKITDQFNAGKIDGAKKDMMVAKLTQAVGAGMNYKQAEAAVGVDPGSLAAQAAADKLEIELRKVYGQAAKELKQQLDEFIGKYGPEMKKLEMDFINGTISAEDLKWIQAKNLQKKILEQKIEQMTGTLLDANKKALGMINGEQLNVFAENANWQAYQITQDAGLNLMFSVYDESTAAKLLKDKPELLPRKVVNGKKDKAWNQKKISGAVLQAVLQGESINKLAKRIAAQTASTNMSAMMRYARTAMTGAQNAGRMEMLHRAQGMGIKCKKTWLATLDGRTRDTHQHLDGKTVGVDEKFDNGLMFPGDPNGTPGEVYNCRCTLIYEYDGFPNDPAADQRIDNESGQLVQNMSYDEWKAAKQASSLNALNAAKLQLAEAQKAVIKAKVKEDKVYEGIWKDPVTLADYPAKKASIAAKMDYYNNEVDKYLQAQNEGKSWATDDKLNELYEKRNLLKEYEKNGKLIEKRDAALKNVQDIYTKSGFGQQATVPAVAEAQKKAQNKAKKAAVPKNGGKSAGTAAGVQSAAPAKPGTGSAPFGPEAYTKERMDKALWTTNQKKVDGMMRARTGEVWRNASDREKEAIYEYTQSFSKFNEPLRGIEYGTNRYLGVGHTDLNAGSRNNGRKLNAMTDIIDKCSYDHDQWFQRCTGFNGMEKFFQCSESLLRNGSQKQLENELLGKTVTEYGFMSMGSAKGKGFSGNIMLNIYAPSGTRMMYVEPFSAYSGSYEHLGWDGVSTQSRFGHEFETIMQQGTQFQVAKVERSGNQIYVDLHVINQLPPQRYK